MSSPQEERALDPETVIELLTDPDCRRILERLDEPRTAAEIRRTCDVPRSTVYRKLDRMSDVGLLDESTIIDTHGQNSTEYSVDVFPIEIRLRRDGSISVSTQQGTSEEPPPNARVPPVE